MIVEKSKSTIRYAVALSLLGLGAAGLLVSTSNVRAQTKNVARQAMTGASSYEVDCKSALSTMISDKNSSMAYLSGSILSKRGSLSLTAMDRASVYSWKPAEKGAPQLVLKKAANRFYSSDLAGVRGHGVDVYETFSINLYTDGRVLLEGRSPKFRSTRLDSMRCFKPAQNELELSGYTSRKTLVTLRLEVPVIQ